MIRFIARFLGSVLLAIAVVFAVGDIARSLTSDLVQIATLQEALALLRIDLAQGAGGSGGEPLQRIMSVAGPWPASVTIASLALVLLFLGRPRHKRNVRYAR